jgi:hypothetical protein
MNQKNGKFFTYMALFTCFKIDYFPTIQIKCNYFVTISTKKINYIVNYFKKKSNYFRVLYL